MSLKELVVHLAQRKASGRLSFACGEVSKELVLAEGAVINARSNLSREYLGQFLINAGLLTEDQFHKAYETQKETRIYIGKILTMIGVVTEAQVASALALKFRETLLSALGWKDGEFTFVPGAASEQLEGVEARVPLEEVVREADFRETAWEAIRSAFPSGDLRLELHPEKLSGPVKPGSVDARIFEMIQAGLTIDEMALGLHATDFFLYQRLYALYRQEVVSIRAAEPPIQLEPAPFERAPTLEPVTGLEPSAEEMAVTARALLADGNARDAAEMAARAAELSGLAEHRELQRRAETEWLAGLRRELLYQDWIPTLRVSVEALKLMALTAPQRYLISRVDGVRTLRAIVQSSPVPELEALRTFRDFADGQLLELTARAA